MARALRKEVRTGICLSLGVTEGLFEDPDFYPPSERRSRNHPDSGQGDYLVTERRVCAKALQWGQRWAGLRSGCWSVVVKGERAGDKTGDPGKGQPCRRVVAALPCEQGAPSKGFTPGWQDLLQPAPWNTHCGSVMQKVWKRFQRVTRPAGCLSH